MGGNRDVSKTESDLVGDLRAAGERITTLEQALARSNVTGDQRAELELVRMEQDRMIQVLDILNAETTLRGLMRALMRFIKELSGCQAVGIRLRDGEDFPYYETTGFDDEFVRLESHLCVTEPDGQILRDEVGNPVLECMCGNILCGRFDPSLPFFTNKGSFYSNCTSELLANTSEEDRQARTRNRCNGEGYESVFLVPLRAGGTTFGLLQLNDRRTGCLSPALVRLVERLAGHVAMCLAHRAAEREARRLEEQLAQSRKMESIGRLAGGIAHDFNNMLSVILGRVEMLMDRVGPGNPFYGDLSEIARAGERSAELTGQLLTFARKQKATPRVIDLNREVEGAVKMLARLIGEDVRLDLSCGTDLWPVKMDPIQAHQILANLCVNARDAIAGSGRIHVGTRNAVVDEKMCADRAELIPGEYVVVTVSDTGAGMEREVLEHLFEPFFTTKAAGEGTGLGLATVYGVVRQNRGHVEVESEQGRGSTFRIYLPRCSREEAAGDDTTRSERVLEGSETVLVVEDEPSILEMCRMMLQRFGYSALCAGSPSQAMRMVRNHEGAIHLLVSDVVMPGMSGLDLVGRLRELNPDTRFLFMSGHTPEVVSRHGVREEETGFIRKPFSIATFAAKVREALDAPPVS